MGKKQAKAEQTAQDFAQTDRVYRRMVASKAVLSGKIGELRKKTIDEGAPPWRILRYQRIVDPESKSYPISLKGYVRPAAFEGQLKYLKKNCRVVPLPQLLSEIESGTAVEEGTVSITFDGGYRECFLNALPLLQKHSLPATFVLPTGYIGSRNFFWQEKIVTTMMVFKNIGLNIPPFSFLDKTFYSTMQKIAPDGEVRGDSIGLLVEGLARATPDQREVALAIIGNMLADVADLPQENCFMSWNEVRMLIRAGHSIATHGQSHMWFHEFPVEDLRTDLEASLRTLADEEIPHCGAFAYPDGILTPDSMNLVQSLGFRAQLTLGAVPLVQPETVAPRLLGRVPIYQDVSFCNELFVCRLWELQIAGVQF